MLMNGQVSVGEVAKGLLNSRGGFGGALGTLLEHESR